MRVPTILVKSLAACLAAVALHSGVAFGQRRLPRSEDYPVSKSERYKGKTAPVVLGNRRARLYRTVLREGAKNGPNFAGHYTIVTWGAGLATFSMAVVDARTGRVYFPPFEEVGASSYGLPFLDKGDNPAWRIDSKLFAFVGMPDWDESKGEGLYLYTFERGRFRLVRFTRNDAEGRRVLGLEP
ncbi:MAG: hypothetical protein ACJ754_25215 [Pyrinomonadaceae bacterium]